MMGYVFAIGSCWTCGKMFTFNPVRVPSVKDGNGVRQPICRDCMEHANKIRQEKGLEAFLILSDAYEPCDESELG
jgi:hypothetical protein